MNRIAIVTLCFASLLSLAPCVLADEPASQVARLLTLLDLKRPELATVRTHAEAGRFDEAMDALGDYYRQRRFPRDQVNVRVFNRIHEDADMAVELRFRSRGSDNYYKLHQDFDWRNRPEHLGHHWLALLVSLHEFQFLADVYLRTGDEKYARGFVRVFEDWNKHCPPGSGSPSWSLAPTMIRSGVMLRTFERIVHWQEWPHESKARFFNNIHDHLMFMQARRGPGNQDASNSEHLMRLAAGFPEFKAAPSWMQTGYERLSERIFEEILEDGVLNELASGYHHNAINTYTIAAERMLHHGLALSPAYLRRLEKMYEWALVMIRPDGSVPIVGRSAASGVRGVLRRGADLFDRPDMLYVATQGAEGTPPNFLDGARSKAAFYTMRSGWTDPDALYLFLCARRNGYRGHVAHDALHIDLFAYGRDFFPDKNTYTYGGDYQREARKTEKHTTVTIDEKSQNDTPSVVHAFIPSSASDPLSFIDASQAGYPGAEHRRQVVFVRAAEGVMPYYIVIDRITGQGERTVDQYFHFCPAELIVEDGGATVRTNFDDGANLRITQLHTEGIATELVTTNMHPRQGLAIERPGARFRRRTALPTSYVTLLLPYPNAEAPQVEAQVVESDAAGPITVHVTQGDVVDALTVQARAETAPDHVAFERNPL